MAARSNFVQQSGLLAGQFFKSEYQYQRANAQALGLTGYGQQRQLFSLSWVKGIFSAEKKAQNFGPEGKLPPAERSQLQQVIAQFTKYNPTTKKWQRTFDPKDHTTGGGLDQFLQALRRRTGQEKWLAGETPR